MAHEAWTPVSTHALALGEGLRPAPGGVRWVDLMAGELYAWTPGSSGGPVLTHKLDRPLGVAELDRAGRLIAAAGTGITELLDGGGERVLADTGLDPARYRVNDGAFAPDGSFWFGTMVHDGSEPAGAVWRWDPASNDVVKLLEGISTPNGPAFLPQGAGVLVADSDAGRILHTTVADPAAVTPFADVAGGSPDGMHIDARGRIWNAVWGAARLDVYAEDTQLLGSVPLPVSQPTSVLVTTGPDPLLLVTSALTGLKEPAALDGFTLGAPLSRVLPGFVA